MARIWLRWRGLGEPDDAQVNAVLHAFHRGFMVWLVTTGILAIATAIYLHSDGSIVLLPVFAFIYIVAVRVAFWLVQKSNRA